MTDDSSNIGRPKSSFGEKSPRPFLKVNAGKFETPFTIKQVETHLVFGPLARNLSCAWLGICLFGIVVVVLMFTNNIGTQGLPSAPGAIFALFVLWSLTRASLRQQAIFGWVIVKSMLFVICGMFITMTLPLWLRDSRTDLRPLAFLGFIWFPLLEFVPWITLRQRYLTAARIVLSVPCLIDMVIHKSWK